MRIRDVDSAVVAVDVLQQARRLTADGWGVFGPLAGGELLDPSPKVVQDARAPLEVVYTCERVHGRFVSGAL